jgi:hypothetical protein
MQAAVGQKTMTPKIHDLEWRINAGAHWFFAHTATAA